MIVFIEKFFVPYLHEIKTNLSICTSTISEVLLWRNRPMRELLKFRNLKKRDCATVAERCRVLPPLHSPLFALRVAGLRGNCWVEQQ
jgi:hypothetical protein